MCTDGGFLRINSFKTAERLSHLSSKSHLDENRSPEMFSADRTSNATITEGIMAERTKKANERKLVRKSKNLLQELT